MNRVYRAFASLCAVPLLFGNLNAVAEELVIEEIVVMATKRAKSVQDVPVSVNAVDAQTIESLGIDEFTDITKIAPALTVNQGDWATNSGINLRGIGTNVFSINIEPSVAVIVDDVPLVRSAQAFSDLMDIERIEVLRGPQSTLFGKSSSAGVISVTTKSPGDEFNLNINALTTNDDETSFSASVGGPISDVVGFHLSGYFKDREDGHIKNLANGDDINGTESSGARGKLVWDLSDAFTATLQASFSESDVECCARPYRDVHPDAFFLGNFIGRNLPASVMMGGLVPSEDHDKVRIDDPVSTESDDWSSSLRLSWGLGEHELLSITSYTEWDYQVTTDFDGTDFDYLRSMTRGALSGGVNQGGGFELDSLSQELRLVSPPSEGFEYVLGLFYSDINFDRDFMRGPLFGANWLAETGTETIALYGQATWGISEQTDLIIGLRLNEEKISHVFDDIGNGTYFSGSDTETAVPGRLGIQHYLNDDVMLFASYSIGYKGQGYDIASGFNQTKSDNPVGSEDSDAFEIGMKATFLGGRLQFNPTVFHAKYDDFQAQQARIVGQDVVLGIANVGKLETTGVELDFQALISESFRIVGGVAWVDAEIKEFAGADCWAGQMEGCAPSPAAGGRRVQDLSGKELNNSPNLKFTLSAEYNIPAGDLPFNLFVNASYQWQDDVNFSLLADPGAVQESYGVFNLSLGLVEREQGEYKATLFVNNLFDQDFVQGIFNAGGLWGGVPVYAHNYTREASRYVGLRLGLSL